MNKLYKENGFLSSFGEAVTESFAGELQKLLNHPDIQEMSEGELRTLGGSLQKIVADAISNRVQIKNALVKQFEAMSDEQFEAYLKNKYGEEHMFVTITKEERDRYTPIVTARVKKFFEESEKNWIQHYPSGVRFK